MTYMVPPYVGAMAWLRLLNPNVGIINQWLRALFGLAAPGPLNVYTLPGMIWVLTTFYYPYAFITISRAMEKMDPSLEEASSLKYGDFSLVGQLQFDWLGCRQSFLLPVG